VWGAAERREQVEQCVAELHRIWHAPGFLHPDPEPPVIIAAFGPKMAELAGRFGDGINTRATHPRLRELVGTARRASRDPDHLLVTVFADFDERWLSPDDPGRRELDELGAHRLVLAMTAPFDHRRLASAGHLLGG
jgi:alkanesulfonate monooxygenase SsuD/methylene tetrahydromethanopterin reductase-like flavin-dependent oxidoreductase (luciferase family)